MSELTYEENVQKVREMFAQVEYETILKMPLWMRLNFYAAKLSKAKADGHADNEINWDYINEMCVKDLSPFDYNRYKPVNTFEDFERQRFDVICATEGVHAWHEHTCKDCGKTFYMMHDEVVFYQDKNLSIPKRCKECRQKRKEKANGTQ
jgi:hypothetical protein